MVATINADTTNGVVITSDTSGEIKLQSAGTDIATVSSTGITMASGKTITGNVIPATAPAFAARLSSNQSISNATWTKMALATEAFDTNNNFDNVTNYRFTPTVAGYYHFTVSGFASVSGGQRQLVAVYKNGSEALTGVNIGTTVGGGNCTITSGLLYANGSTDYFEGWYYQDSGSTATLVSATQLTWFDGHLVQQA